MIKRYLGLYFITHFFRIPSFLVSQEQLRSSSEEPRDLKLRNSNAKSRNGSSVSGFSSGFANRELATSRPSGPQTSPDGMGQVVRKRSKETIVGISIDCGMALTRSNY